MDQDKFNKAVAYAISRGYFRDPSTPDINQSTDEDGLITLRTPGRAKVAEFQTDGDTFQGLGNLSTKPSITQFSTSEEKAVAWAMSMGYPVPTKMNGCATGLLVAVGLLCAIVPGILLLVWLGVQENQYKRDMAALVAKWVDAGKPEPGEGAAAMNDVLDSIEAKSKGTGDADDTNKTEQQTKKETVMKNANEKAAAATTRRTRTETAAAAAAAKKKTRANSNSKGSEETNDSETAESDLISIEVAKRTRAVRRLQSNAKGLQVSQSEVSLVKLVES